MGKGYARELIYIRYQVQRTISGNGWSLLAKMEALIGMEELALTDDPVYQFLLGQFVDHSRGLRRVQSQETGYDNATFYIVSSNSMSKQMPSMLHNNKAPAEGEIIPQLK